MNKRYIIILTLTIVVLINVVSFSQSNYKSFNELEQATTSINQGDIFTNFNSLAKIIMNLKNQAKKDEDIKQHLIDQIMLYSQKQYTEDTEQNKQESDNDKDGDRLYTIYLIDILSDIDNEAFLEVAKNILTNNVTPNVLKNIMIDRVFSEQRINLFITNPEKLREYDKQIMSIGKEIIDPNQDGFTFGNKSDFLSFIRILTGINMPANFKIPPLDREYGIKLAQNIIQNEKLQLVDKVPYMEVVSKYDSSTKQLYIETLKQYVEDKNAAISLRVYYAKKLLSLGEIDKSKVNGLEQELEKYQKGIKIENGKKMPLEK